MFAPKSARAGTDAHASKSGKATPVGPAFRPSVPAVASRFANEDLAAPGRPLDPGARARLEPRFGFDFSHVRIHAGAAAARSAAQVGARAYTVGSHIVFGDGRYDPGSRAGLPLLAHELAHVVQQGRVTPGQLADPSRDLRSSTPAEEHDAEWASMEALAGQNTDLAPGAEPALARADKAHSDEELGDAINAFREKNDHLSPDQLSKIRSAVIKATRNAKTYEVAYRFFDYYSGWTGQQIRLMGGDEAKRARDQHRMAETDAGGDTRLQPDALNLGDEALGAVLLHELSHTGQQSTAGGAGDYQEGQSYGIEYFYAERSQDTDRMQKIANVISAGAVTVPSQRAALRQLFKEAYAIMTVLRKLSVTGSAPELPFDDLTAEDGDVLLAEYVTNFAEPSKKLQKIIDQVKRNPASFRTPPLP